MTVAVVALPSCSDSRKFPKTYPVKGKILVNGQPANDCQIYLRASAAGSPATQVTPNAVTSTNGEFQITSFRAKDGAPEGEYVVTIEWRERSGLTKQEFEGPDQLGGDYARADKTKNLPGFVVKVAKQPLELPPFELKQTAEAKRKLEEAKRQRPSFGGPLGGGDK